MEDKPIRVLMVTVKMRRGGGMQNMLMDYYRAINHENIQFDFLYHVPTKQTYDDEIESLGGKVYRVTNYRTNIFKKIVETIQIMKQYKHNGIVHIHTSSGIRLLDGLLARLCGVKTIIFHSHSNIAKKPIKYYLTTPLFRLIGTHYFGCSNDAAIKFFGKDVINSEKYLLVKNAISLDLYKFDQSRRNRIREKFNIDENDVVIGYVGRLSEEKNLLFLYDIFYEIYKKEEKSKLLVVGNGEFESKIISRAKKDNVEEKLIMAGIREDVPDIMKAIDAFVLPSKNEGLGIVLIEAQAAGTKCYTSDKVVPSEAKCTELLEYISLDKSASEWANIIYTNGFEYTHQDTTRDLELKGYSIVNAAEKLEQFYLKVSNDNET